MKFENKLFSLIGGGGKNIEIANNLTTSVEGYVLDARQGKILNDKINEEPIYQYITGGLYAYIKNNIAYIIWGYPSSVSNIKNVQFPKPYSTIYFPLIYMEGSYNYNGYGYMDENGKITSLKYINYNNMQDCGDGNILIPLFSYIIDY